MKSAFLSLTAVTVFTIFALRSVGEAKPAAPGHVVKKGALPTYCTEADFAAGASAYGPNYGYYYSTKSKSWVSTAWCLPKWGFLSSTPSQYVGAGQKVTVTAQAEGGSNNTQYAPETNTISWSVAGKVASG